MFQSRRFLIVLDGHKSHINLDVLLKAKEYGIDMKSIPSYTSHGLQHIDKAYFRPFKVAFRAYRDLWNLENKGKKCRKEDLVQWTSLAFRNALVPKNIISGFRATRIWPLNPLAMAFQVGPSEVFNDQQSKIEEREKILEEEFPTAQKGLIHYYESKEDVEENKVEEDGLVPCESLEAKPSHTPHISQFLKIPRAKRTSRRANRIESLVEYSQSQLLTSDEHISNLESMIVRKERLLQKKQQKLIQKKVE